MVERERACNHTGGGEQRASYQQHQAVGLSVTPSHEQTVTSLLLAPLPVTETEPKPKITAQGGSDH